MSDVTVVELAKIVGTPVEKLVLQLKEAGIEVSGEDHKVSDQEKKQLLTHLRKSNASETNESSQPKKITLKRKSVSQLKVASGKSRGSVVNVEVRKKRTYVKRSVIQEQQEQILKEQAELERQEAEAQAKIEQQEQQLAAEQEAGIEASVTEQVMADSEQTTSLPQQESDLEESVTELPEVLATNEAQDGPVQTEAVIEPVVQTDTEAAAPQAEDAQPAVAKVEDKPATTPDSEETFTKKKATKKSKKKHNARALIEAELVDDDYSEVIEDDSGDIAPKTLTKRPRRKSGAKSSKADVSAIVKHGFEKPTAPIIREVSLSGALTVSELAQKMSVKATEVVKTLMTMGVMASINQSVDQDTAVLVVEEMGHKVRLVSENALEESIMVDSDEGKNIQSRCPVVTIMGHVDHGKTSLLDTIRRSRVAAGEAGGITQHIGAYQVKTPKGEITFLDTPGHAAFTAMRARGAQCTDIIILVVAADDGVMPQTEEAIQHARAAEVPMIVAVNKIDKPEADPERVKTELSQKEVIPEEWGGDIQFVPISAKEGTGIDELLDAVLLQAELAELKAPVDGPARGIIIEARLDKGRGPVATVLVQGGTLDKGDVLLSGGVFGKIRALMNGQGQMVKRAGPSVPVEVLGLSGVPSAGDDAVVVENEKKAREVAAARQDKTRAEQVLKQAQSSDVFAQLAQDELKQLNIVLKADVHGSLEAISDAMSKLSNEEVNVSVIYRGVGGINESDIQLAKASNALTIGFNVRADATARRVAEEESVSLYYYSVIYDVVDEITKAVKGLVSPKIKEVIIGIAEVRDVFRSSKLGAIAGCMVIEGNVKRNNPIRVLRDNVVIYEGELESLKRFKENANEVRNGMECGIGVKNYNDVKVGDQIEVFDKIEVSE